MSEQFHCDSFGLDMPADKQRGFCAKQYRMERAICKDCEMGRTAAREDREMAICKHTCDTCGKEFEGGPTAKTCKNCKPAPEKKNDGKGKASLAKPAVSRAERTAKTAKKTAPKMESHESVKVIETLVAIGVVTSAQIDATRKYVREMHTEAS